MENSFPVEVWVPVSIILAIFIAILLLRNFSKREEALRKENAKIRGEILENGYKAEATVVNSRVIGTVSHGDRRSLVAGKFEIKILDTGEEYTYRRKEIAVPMQYIGEFTYGNIMPVYVHKDDRDLILFEFDRRSPALGILFRDP